MPPNAGYAVAAYVLTAVVLVGYAWKLLMNARSERRQEARGKRQEGRAP